ncbi:MAG: hypothetical protein KF900_14100 [Bacteroidetes bacterium]|nr:hypothetical protein [Bacteroidota bacterium]
MNTVKNTFEHLNGHIVKSAYKLLPQSHYSGKYSETFRAVFSILIENPAGETLFISHTWYSKPKHAVSHFVNYTKKEAIDTVNNFLINTNQLCTQTAN